MATKILNVILVFWLGLPFGLILLMGIGLKMLNATSIQADRYGTDYWMCAACAYNCFVLEHYKGFAVKAREVEIKLTMKNAFKFSMTGKPKYLFRNAKEAERVTQFVNNFQYMDIDMHKLMKKFPNQFDYKFYILMQGHISKLVLEAEKNSQN